MKTVNALTLRRSLGRVLDEIERSGEPVTVEKGHRARAVLVPLAEYERHFVD